MSIEQSLEDLIRRVIREELDAAGLTSPTAKRNPTSRGTTPSSDHLTPKEVCELVPGMTTTNLAQLRFKGQGPKFESTGDRLARYRKAAGISAQRLADEIGATRAVINNIESGRREDMTVGQLVQIAHALGIPAAALAANIYDPFGPSGYGDLSNWDVVDLLSREGHGADLIWPIEVLMDVKGDWGRQANEFPGPRSSRAGKRG